MIAEEPESVITGQKTGGEAVAGGGGGGGATTADRDKEANF